VEYKGGRLNDIETAVIIRQVLMGIQYLHGRDIVHRDLKPDNILMTGLEDGARIVITDFGHARQLPADQDIPGIQSFDRRRMYSYVGTLEYAAP
jgi:serine/threonine protein kinase